MVIGDKTSGGVTDRRSTVAEKEGTAGRDVCVGSGSSSEPERPGDFLVGVVTRGGSLGAGTDVSVTPVATPEAGRPWVQGQARGYTMLYAMQPEARAVVETQVQTLLAARVREPYIGVLIDGTFGRDFSYLKDVITRLSIDGRDLTLVLYLSNGPTMRAPGAPTEHLFSRITPEDFRRRIRWDQSLRTKLSAVATQARDVFLFSASVNAGNNHVAIVMLEDNLDVVAYRSMRELANQQLESIAGFIRNPCVGAGVDGNDDDTAGDPREEHQLERFNLLRAEAGF